ncbi:OLC1v1035308C2 [Oldenlandia corymbosa var. corymbosa]|nr:OLC1v1035308C2 [Oldenlandia corymbosa var. corymbosa]
MAANRLQNASGDQALIDRVCARMPDPTACQMCIKEDPEHENEDEPGLGRASMVCCIGRILTINRDIYNMANSSRDGSIRDICTKCTVHFDDSLKNLRDALVFWGYDLFQNATDSVGIAHSYFLQCANIIVGLPSPNPYIEALDTLEILLVNSEAMLSLL